MVPDRVVGWDRGVPVDPAMEPILAGQHLLEVVLVVRTARVALGPGLVVWHRAGVAPGRQGCWHARWTFRLPAWVQDSRSRLIRETGSGWWLTARRCQGYVDVMRRCARSRGVVKGE